jgi:hypothetical protein
MHNSNPTEAVEKGFWPVPSNPDNEMGFIDLRNLAKVTKRTRGNIIVRGTNYAGRTVTCLTPNT